MKISDEILKLIDLTPLVQEAVTDWGKRFGYTCKQAKKEGGRPTVEKVVRELVKDRGLECLTRAEIVLYDSDGQETRMVYVAGRTSENPRIFYFERMINGEESRKKALFETCHLRVESRALENLLSYKLISI